jgi:hypothetical protein
MIVNNHIIPSRRTYIKDDLINSMSFGEFMFSAGFILKTIKEDLHVRLNYTNLS